jgi:hypothetical protein
MLVARLHLPLLFAVALLPYSRRRHHSSDNASAPAMRPLRARLFMRRFLGRLASAPSHDDQSLARDSQPRTPATV